MPAITNADERSLGIVTVTSPSSSWKFRPASWLRIIERKVLLYYSTITFSHAEVRHGFDRPCRLPPQAARLAAPGHRGALGQYGEGRKPAQSFAACSIQGDRRNGGGAWRPADRPRLARRRPDAAWRGATQPGGRDL